VRFCPFCSAENADELAVCQSCGRRLPPLPPRRARNAPGTGVLLPPRPATATNPPLRARTTTQPPRPATPTQPPPVGTASPLASLPRPASPSQPPPLSGAGPAPSVPPSGPRPASPSQPPPPGAAQPGTLVTSAGLVPVAPSPGGGLRAPAAPPASSRETITALPPPPPSTLLPAPPLEDGARALANALSPGPAAQRREAPPAEPLDPAGPARRRLDPVAAVVPPASGPRPMPSVLPAGPRAQPAAPRASAVAPHPTPGADPPWATGYPRAPADFGKELDTQPSASPLAIDASRARSDDGVDPPPTRIHRPEALVDRPFTPPQVSPVPEIPEPGLVNSARYSLRFARARWQRRGAIKLLGGDIKKDTDALDQVLGALGGVARAAKVDSRVFSGENAAINDAEDRVAQITRDHNDVDARKLDENAKFVDIERERNTKLGEAERMLDEAQKELAQLEAQRRGLRDKRKELERRQKAYLKAAEDNDKQTRAGAIDSGPLRSKDRNHLAARVPLAGTGNADLGDSRQELRRAAEQHRREAAALEPERQDIDRRLASIERPISEVTAKLDAAKAELDAAKRSLSDAREGHTHRLAELDAEQKRKAREIAQTEGEIARRLVTLGTLVNLNRIEDPRFAELYHRIDRLRGAITARTTEIEKLTAEREAYDRGNLVRGVAVIGGAIVLFIALIVILRAVLLR
jgi:hypothetical protein